MFVWVWFVGFVWVGKEAGFDVIGVTGWERTVHVSRCPALYSGRIFVSLCRELIIFVF